MRTIFFAFFTLIFLTSNLSAQNNRIIKIIDSNLFMLEDSTLIQLAGIDAPSKNHPDELLREVAEEINEYASTNFLNHPLEILYAGESYINYNAKLVFINKNFLFSKKNINTYFLERGFGKFIDNSIDIDYNLYKISEQNAKEKNKGIWNIKNIEQERFLDRSNYDDGYYKSNSILSENQFIYDRNFSRILLEIPAGLLGGILTGFGSGFLVSSISDYNSASTGIAFLAGYIVGNSLGVYFIAKGGNKDLSFEYTLVSSAVSTAAATGIILSEKSLDDNYGYLASLSPLVGAMIYANTIGYPDEANDNLSKINFIENYNTHYKFFEHTTLKLNLFKIDF